MRYKFDSDRVYVVRTPEDRAPFINRLSRIEGQVRGLRQMIEADRYCGDEIQQVNAITAALREVALMLISTHVDAGIHCASDPKFKDAALAEVVALMRNGLKL